MYRPQTWQRALQELSTLRVAQTDKALLHSAQKVFEFRGKNGKLLAWLAKGDIPATPIDCVRDKDDHILTASDQINACFLQFFQDLYSSRADFSPSNLNAFLDPISFPTLAAEDSERLDADITLEEVQLAMGQLKNGKASKNGWLAV